MIVQLFRIVVVLVVSSLLSCSHSPNKKDKAKASTQTKPSVVAQAEESLPATDGDADDLCLCPTVPKCPPAAKCDPCPKCEICPTPPALKQSLEDNRLEYLTKLAGCKPDVDKHFWVCALRSYFSVGIASRPGVYSAFIIGNRHCPPCKILKKKARQWTRQFDNLDIYYLDVTAGIDPEDDAILQLVKELGMTQYPGMIVIGPLGQTSAVKIGYDEIVKLFENFGKRRHKVELDLVAIPEPPAKPAAEPARQADPPAAVGPESAGPAPAASKAATK